jgi:hypothetical protein
MSILVVGSVAFDTLKTAYGERQKILGGSATYFSLAASYFTKVRVVAVVGEDFTGENEKVMRARGIDTTGIERAKGKTFHWGGEYGENLNEAKTSSRTFSRAFRSSTPTPRSCFWRTSIRRCSCRCAVRCRRSRWSAATP